MNAKKIELRHGVLVIDDKPYETFEEIDELLCNLCGRETADQLWAEAYHMYKTNGGLTREEEELSKINVRIK